MKLTPISDNQSTGKKKSSIQLIFPFNNFSTKGNAAYIGVSLHLTNEQPIHFLAETE